MKVKRTGSRYCFVLNWCLIEICIPKLQTNHISHSPGYLKHLKRKTQLMIFCFISVSHICAHLHAYAHALIMEHSCSSCDLRLSIFKLCILFGVGNVWVGVHENGFGGKGF